MYVIGHRGAAGLAPENTLESIEVAQKYGVDAIEIDIRATSDNRLILCHDHTLLREANTKKQIKDLRLRQIQITITNSGHPIPTLAEALEAAGDTPMVIEGKGPKWAELLAVELLKHQGPAPIVISDNQEELFVFAQQDTGLDTYLITWTRPFEAMYLAKNLGFSGISLNFALYSPLTYWYGRSQKLKMIMSPVNKRWLARLLHFLYPTVAITTDFPDRLVRKPLLTRLSEKSKDSTYTRRSQRRRSNTVRSRKSPKNSKGRQKRD